MVQDSAADMWTGDTYLLCDTENIPKLSFYIKPSDYGCAPADLYRDIALGSHGVSGLP